MELVAGTVVAERFRLDSELGKGGMGSVWSATHLVTRKKVALKFMHANSAELTARFVREAQTASAVRHPNVVEIHDVLSLPDGTPLMVMEMLTGESLASRLARERRLSPTDTAFIFGPVVSAVAAAHAAGIVHRDLKPDNIFLAEYAGSAPVPKVLDFGIAKLVAQNAGPSESALTRTGSLLGTPYYMSPEQVFGEKDVDVRADIWSLGVILYECVCGQRPFEGDNFGQLLKAVTIGRFEPIENLAPWVGPQLSSLIGRMLRERSTRLADLSELEHALSAIRGTPSGPMLPTSMPRMSAAASAATVLPNTGSGSWGGSGSYPMAANVSGGHPALGSQSSGGHPSAPRNMAMTPSSGGYPVAQSPAMTPSPMVRSHTVEMAPRPDVLPMQSPPVGKIVGAIGAVLVLALGAVLVVRGVHHGDSTTTTNTATASGATTDVVTATVTTPIVPPSAPPSSAVVVPPASNVDAGAAAPHGTNGGSHPGLVPSGTASVQQPQPNGANSSSNHNGATGGLSTAVPF